MTHNKYKNNKLGFILAHGYEHSSPIGGSKEAKVNLSLTNG